MLTLFPFYFKMGYGHILDWAALDHILFLMVLCAVYSWKAWRQVAWLVTAFTIGHFLTLFLSGLEIVKLPVQWVEVLIPASIVLTAVFNLTTLNKQKQGISYALALGFGLIHGLGFSNTFRALLFPDEQHTLWQQLLAFNLGVEVGQLIVVALLLSLAYLVLDVLKTASKTWVILLSVGAGLAGLWMMVERVV